MAVYCTDADLDNRFGADIIDQYARVSKTDDAAALLARRLWAREQASRDLDDELRGGQYEVPFTGPAYDPTVVDCTAYLALIRLYELKGTLDFNPESGKPQHRYHWQRERVYNKLRRIRAGSQKLALATTYKTSLGVRNDRVATGALEGKVPSDAYPFADPQVDIADEEISFG